MKWIFYLAVLTASLLIPVERIDIGKLQPVEVISLYIEDGNVVIETDTSDLGKGSTVGEALEDLKRTTPGIVYLDTAEYLMVSEETEALVLTIGQYLKENVKLCCSNGDIDLVVAAQYLDIHSPEQSIGAWTEDVEMEWLLQENDRLRLVKKN